MSHQYLHKVCCHANPINARLHDPSRRSIIITGGLSRLPTELVTYGVHAMAHQGYGRNPLELSKSYIMVHVEPRDPVC